MIRKITPTGNADKTVQIIDQLVKKFSVDLGDLKNMGLREFYDFVKNHPYRRDPRGTEVVCRPKYILAFGRKIGRDCKKQTILIASWARENRVPYRFCVVSAARDRHPHHIFVELFLRGNWIPADATYQRFQLGVPRTYTYKKNYEVTK